MTQRVFVDSNVLYSKTLMDWLFFLKIENERMFQLHASEDVFAEVISNMRKHNPRLPGRVIHQRSKIIRERIIDEVAEAFPPDLSFTGNDEHDYHVHAAAIACQADLLLSNNRLSDFTTADNEPYEVISPDDFFVLVAESASSKMLYPIVKNQFAYWASKPKFRQLDDSLRKAGCPKFGDIVRQTMQKMVLENAL